MLHSCRNGSTIVDFEIKYREDPGENKKTVVAETVKEKIIKTGNLGNFKLKSVKIQGKNHYVAFLIEKATSFTIPFVITRLISVQIALHSVLIVIIINYSS